MAIGDEMKKDAKSGTGRKRRLVLSVGYWFGSHSQGLLIHPYPTMRRIVREGVYEPLRWLPSMVLVLWWVVGFAISRWNVLSGLGLAFLAVKLERLGATQLIMSFVFVWGVVWLLLWQGLLVYLYRRFKGMGRNG